MDGQFIVFFLALGVPLVFGACIGAAFRGRFGRGLGLVTLARLWAVRLGAADTDGRGRFLFWRCVLAGGAPEEAGSGKNAVGLAATLNSPQAALCFPGLRNSPHEL